VIMERSALPALLLTLLLGLLMQAMLVDMRIASGQGEWVYRALYVIALAVNLAAVRRANPPTFRSACVVLAPMVLAVAATWLSITGDDAHAAIMLMVLPIVHTLVAGFLFTMPHELPH